MSSSLTARYFFPPMMTVVLSLAGCACDDDPSEEIDNETASGYGALRSHMDLLERVHLADIDHQGTFIDLGTPSRMKYTVGHWRTGWVADQRAGDSTFSYVGVTGRLFFQVDEPGPITVRFRAKPVGSRNLSVFLNGNQQELVRFEEGDQFRDYDLTIPGEHVEAGENYMLLRFGGTERVNGVDVAAAMESVRIVGGESIPDGTFQAPVHGSLVADVTVGGASRRALAVHQPTTVSYYVQVPQGGRLGFGVGVEGADPTGASVKVTVTPEGGQPSHVFSQTVGGEWRDQVVSLGDHAGQVVRIDFVANGSGGGRVAWSNPKILSPEVEDEPEPERAKNVVVLLIDTTRASKLRPWNPGSRVQTPVLDRLAREGAVFEAAQSPENWTKPSCASVLTGLHPATHGAKTSEAVLPDGALMLSEHLSANGFSTGSFIANGYVSDRFGFDQGWDHYTNFIRESKSTEAENVFGEAADWIEQHKDDRFFAYIQTIDPHVPYDPPEEFLRMYDDRNYTGQVQPRQTPDLLEQAKRNPPAVTFDGSDRRRLEALHDGEITYHDRELGRFIERLTELGVWEDTLLVITSDHGEEFNEHGSWGHGHSTYQELLHVPLMFYRPGTIPGGVRISDSVTTLDIPSTVLSAVQVDDLPASEGRDLMGFMHGVHPAGPSVAFSDFLDDRRVIRAGQWKLVLRGINAELYDLQNDPGEQNEVDRHDHPIAMRFLRVMLGQFLGARNRQTWLDADQSEGLRLEAEAAHMDDTIRDQLRALGYAN